MNIVRTHDRFYLHEDRRDQPKECVKFIGDKITERIEHKKKPLCLDIGCATGEFIYYMKEQFPQVSFTGIDVMEELLLRARENCPHSEFAYGNIIERHTLPQDQYDFVFMNGVHSIFDDHRVWLDNIKCLTKEGGHAFVFGLFNPEPVDVYVKVRMSDTKSNTDELESGWNVISINTISNYLNEINAAYNWEEWKIGIPIEKNKTDPLRSWTIKDAVGEYIIVNGLQQVLRFFLVEILF